MRNAKCEMRVKFPINFCIKFKMAVRTNRTNFFCYNVSRVKETTEHRLLPYTYSYFDGCTNTHSQVNSIFKMMEGMVYIIAKNVLRNYLIFYVFLLKTKKIISQKMKLILFEI